MDDSQKLLRQNFAIATRYWGALNSGQATILRDLTYRFSFSIAMGDLIAIERALYVTHSGLLRLAYERQCLGIQSQVVEDICKPDESFWAFKAVVFRDSQCVGFSAYADAHPGNVSQLVRGAEMRVAETRAVNRALRKAYGIGLCSADELGIRPERSGPSAEQCRKTPARDRLVQLIREYQLDPRLVKRYALDFCGASELKQASRELVEEFISSLATKARTDPQALACLLNGYANEAKIAS